MTGEVAVWVPIVGVLGSLGVGALVGALSAHLLRERAEQRREERELHGLLRLLRDDMVRDLGYLTRLKGHPEYMGSERHGRMRLETWQEVKVRLAQLMDERDFGAVLDYYAAVETFLILQKRYREAQGTREKQGKEAREQLVENVQPRQALALKVVRSTVASSSLPYSRTS